MNDFLKILLLYLFIGVLNTMIFIRYLESTGLPGGEVGMAPMGIMLGSLISLIISISIYYLIRLKIKLNKIKSILLYEIIYLLILIFAFGGTDPFKEGINNYNNISLWVYLTSFISIAITIIFYSILKGIRNKTKE